MFDYVCVTNFRIIIILLLGLLWSRWIYHKPFYHEHSVQTVFTAASHATFKLFRRRRRTDTDHAPRFFPRLLHISAQYAADAHTCGNFTGLFTQNGQLKLPLKRSAAHRPTDACPTKCVNATGRFYSRWHFPTFNSSKHSGVGWLYFEVFSAIQV